MEKFIGKNLKAKIFILILVGLIALAWFSLFIGNSIFLNHNQIIDIHYLPFLIISWMIMIVAMMLPTILPLVLMFNLMVSDKDDKIKLLILLVIGYLVIWLFFGIIIQIIIRFVDLRISMQNDGYIVASIIMIIAGLYQFTRLKYYCLDKCRSPKNFIISHWQGGNERLQAFRLGTDHGIFCIGCCWSLMLLMVLVGIANVGWMLILTIIMSIEKNYIGKRFSSIIGMSLIGLGLSIYTFHNFT